MGADSKIEWTDHTFNPWWGCTKVSPGCDHCYAEAWAKRYRRVEWGTGKPRLMASDAYWHQPLKWNDKAKRDGIRRRVFCASMADVFDNEVPGGWTQRLWATIGMTPHLDWLVLTKRIGNAPKMLPLEWGDGWPNVWLGISVVNQEEADRDIPKLLAVPARVRFLSCEPLLGRIKLSQACRVESPELTDRTIDWVIVGGESGPGARPMNPEWARYLRAQCENAGVPFFFKQWGEWVSVSEVEGPGAHHRFPDGATVRRTGKKLAGRLLDGREHSAFPLPQHHQHFQSVG